MMPQKVKIFQTPFEAAETAALEIVNMIRDRECSGKPFTIALSGGKTPELLFSVLGDHFGNAVSWRNVHLFWVDERCVPPDHPESNYGLTKTALLDKTDIPATNLHRMKGENDPVYEARRYSGVIKSYVQPAGGKPSFDLILLGLGEDGHTASIFPGNEKLFVSEKYCAAAINPHTGQKRLTITGKLINNGRQVIFLVNGKNKAGILKDVIEKERSTKLYPASYVIPLSGNLVWYIDREAGALLGENQSG